MNLPVIDASIQSKLQAVFNRHPCGDCTACCTIMGVADLGKPYYVPCKDCGSSGGGCRIHSTRPDGCRGFECAWRAGLLDAIIPGTTGRPDRLKLMFDLEEDDTGEYLSVYQVSSAEWKREDSTTFNGQLWRLLQHLCNEMEVCKVRFYKAGSKIPVAFTISEDYKEFKDLEANGRSRWYDSMGLAGCGFYNEEKSMELP